MRHLTIPRHLFYVLIVAVVLAVLGVGPAPDAVAAEPGHSGAGEDTVESARILELRQEIDAYVDTLAEAHVFSGTILVALGELPVYERCVGTANAEHGVPVTPATRFAVASITKPMTDIAAIRLIEEGRLGLRDALSKWLPDFPRGDEIVIEHLLRHQSGIPHRVTDENDETIRYTAADMVSLAATQELLFEPGTSRSYSSAGYSVLARVLELAAGRPYGELLEQYVGGLFSPQDWAHLSVIQADDGTVKALRWGTGTDAPILPRVGPLPVE